MNEANFSPDRAFAAALDAADPLASFREAFVITDPELIYMDGNSLGRMPRRAGAVIRDAVEQQWGDRLIRSWSEGWYTAPRRIGNKIAQLIGAAPGSVVAADSTSVNFYKLVMAALALRPDRRRVVTDTGNFPSDVYILRACMGAERQLTLAEAPAESGEDHPPIFEAIDGDTALITVSHVAFKSGALYDAAALVRRAHEAGALTLLDLSHSAGALPIHLDDWGVDFAVGCTYKYLNGGPGAPAFLYARPGLQAQVTSPIPGWFGEAQPFSFDLHYHPAPGVARFLAGTPPVLSLLAVEPGVDLLLEAGIEPLREKSARQTEYLIALFDHFLAPLGFTLGTPRSPRLRGSHVSIRHPEGYRINRALIEEMQVIPDFREPDNIRLGIAPIYTTCMDIWETVWRTAAVVREKRYEKYPADRAAVT